MHEHYDEVYRSWLFSSDDPADIFMNDPRYFHYSLLGKADVEVYDAEGRFILRLDRYGNKSTDLRDVQIWDNPDAVLEASPVQLFASRLDNQTVIAFPMDQQFFVIGLSHQNEPLRSAYVEYTAKELRGDVQYVLDEVVADGEMFLGNIDPNMINGLTDEDLFEFGFNKLEPWSQEIVYDPSAVMRLENTGIFHPSLRYFLSMGGLILVFAVFILILALIGIGNGVTKGVKRIYKGAKKRKTGTQKTENDADEEKLS